MRWKAGLLIATSAGLLGPTRAVAQATGSRTAGGSMANGLEYSYQSRSIGHGRDTREWLSFVVLWRMPPRASAMTGARTGRPDTAALVAAERRYRDLQRAAEDSGRSFLGGFTGGVIQNAYVSRADRQTLWVEGETFAVPERDSALVVLVDLTGAPAQPARVVGRAYVPAELPEAFWPKHWTSGDTTFLVHSRNAHGILREALRTDPIIRAFVDSAVAAAPPRRN
jgi:hypothetical protein